MGAGLLSDIANTGTELFLTKGVPYLGKKAVEMGRYYGSELMRDPKLQKKAIDYGLRKMNPLLHKVGSEALDQLSTKIRRNKNTQQTEKILMVVLLTFTKLLANCRNQKADGHYLGIITPDHIMIWKIN